MPSLRECLSSLAPPLDSAAAHAARMGFQPPISLRDLILASDVRVFEQPIITPPGTALGGRVKLTVAGDGRFTFSGHMHGSGFDSYQFGIHVLLRADPVGLSVRKTGSVGGTIGGGSRNFDWTDPGSSEAVKTFWPSLRDGNLEVVKSYEDTGILGTAEEIGKTFVAFLVANAMLGPQIAAVVTIGPELMQLANLHAAPDLFAGVIVSGATVLLCGPGMLIPGVIAGYAASSRIRSRQLNAAEETVARSVFDNTLQFSRIYLTDIKPPSFYNHSAFTTLQPDGTILVNLGDGFDAPIAPGRRRTLIHELVHAWQCIHLAYTPERIWEVATNHIVGRSVYDFKWSGERWSDMNIEAQASAVETWFALFEDFPDGGLNGSTATNSPLYRYIADHIRLGIA